MEKSEVQHIAELSRLAFSPSGIEEMGEHLDTVLGYFEMLDSVDTSSVPATAHILDKVNVLREDTARAVPFDRDLLLSNAPEKSLDGKCYVVPRVVD